MDLLGKGTNGTIVENIGAALGVIPKCNLSEIENEIQELEDEIIILRKDKTLNKYQIESSEEELSLLQNELEIRRNSKSPFLNQEFIIGKDTNYQLNLLWNKAGTDLEKFKMLLEQWYDEQMDRITGWYKRKLSLLTFVFGFIIAFTFKVDTIQLTLDLSQNEDMRAFFVEGASEMMAKNENLDSLQIESYKQYFSEELQDNNLVFSLGRIDFTNLTFLNWLGFFITAFAISLGAPFWFDMLSKLMRVRTSLQPEPSPPASTNSSSDNNISKAVG